MKTLLVVEYEDNLNLSPEDIVEDIEYAIEQAGFETDYKLSVLSRHEAREALKSTMGLVGEE